MGEYYREADPINLQRAICVVYDRWMKAGKKPGSDRIANSTRRHRPSLVAEIEEAWCQFVECDPEDDIFPYHESYVVRKWIDFRKMSESVKAEWIKQSLDGLA